MLNKLTFRVNSEQVDHVLAQSDAPTSWRDLITLLMSHTTVLDSEGTERSRVHGRRLEPMRIWQNIINYEWRPNTPIRQLRTFYTGQAMEGGAERLCKVLCIDTDSDLGKALLDAERTELEAVQTRLAKPTYQFGFNGTGPRIFAKEVFEQERTPVIAEPKGIRGTEIAQNADRARFIADTLAAVADLTSDGKGGRG